MSDETGMIASPLEVIDRSTSNAVTRISQLAEEYEAAVIVVGLPRTLAGDEGPSAESARALGAAIASATDRNLVYWDERFTSVEAERTLLEAGMSRKQRRDTSDKVAAAVMLQGYLDAQVHGDL